MAGIKDYSTTASNNTSVGGVSIAEGMLPSNINNAFRAITADIREFYNDSELEPEDSLMFKITLTPFGNINSPYFN